MAHEEEEEPKKVRYPLDSNSYNILHEVGFSDGAVVYKAVCVPLDSMVVAIKAIDLDQSLADLETVRRQAESMSLLSHPNILDVHCSFTVDHRLWVVMPFMSAGSLQSIISSSFPDGLSEPCIAIILNETLSALSYLHNEGYLHRGIKAGNILIDSNGSVKLADFGMIPSPVVAGTPYWMTPEPEVIYSEKADVWSLGITALELAHGRPTLSTINIRPKNDNHEKFSKAFKDMVASCLHQDPSKRPSAEELSKHSFFKNCMDSGFLVKNVLQGLPSVEERFKAEGGDSARQSIKKWRITGWSFNEDRFELDPVFPAESSAADDSVVKQVRLGGESIIMEDKGGASGGSSSAELNIIPTLPGQFVEEAALVGCHSEAENRRSGGEGVDVPEGLVALNRSLDEQRTEVRSTVICQLGGEVSMEGEEEEKAQVIERFKRLVEVVDRRRRKDI
jgi:serine/threonine-protein kinase OSR1/STK39